MKPFPGHTRYTFQELKRAWNAYNREPRDNVRARWRLFDEYCAIRDGKQRPNIFNIRESDEEIQS